MTVRILSLGAGVQSTTLLLMACAGDLQIDRAIFADTRWEPSAVYAHLTRLESEAARAGIPVERVTGGNLREDALASHSSAWLPLHIRNHRGEKGMVKRQCTANYKIRPIKRAVRALGATAAHPVEMVIGISYDEMHRMRTSDVRYMRNTYPLVEWRMTRADCQAWLIAHGWGSTMKSACLGCPFHSDRDWRRLRDRNPAEWAQTVEFDRVIRTRRSDRFDSYLHPSLTPLDLVDLRTVQDRGQTEMFVDDEAGGCSPFGCRAEALA